MTDVLGWIWAVLSQALAPGSLPQLAVTMVRLSVPYIMAAVGEIIIEKAGVVNIGIEGTMLISAFTGTLITYFTGNPVLGLLAGVAVAILLGALHGAISVYLKGDQIVAGVGVNAFAMGITVVGLKLVWGGSQGQSAYTASIQPISLGPGINISPLFFVALAAALIGWWLLFRTTLGLKIRACGEDPKAAEAMGVNVERMRFLVTTLAASLFGLAGAYLSLDWTNAFTKNMTNGRGFIALANVAFSGWNPLLAIVGGLIFGFFEALALRLNAVLSVVMPSASVQMTYIVQAIPYIAVIIVVAIFAKRARAPSSLAKPYIKE